MGDTHVGLQARLMSQALRKLTANLNKTNTICIFINQLREKIGVMFGSPETTPGGRALKFYSSVRLDIRRIESIKDGVEVVGNRTRVKVVKNKVAPPFRQAEFDIMYGKGISREGSLLDIGVDIGIVKKSGAWYTYEGEQLGQGRENAKQFLIENPEIMVEISERILTEVGIGQDIDESPSATRRCRRRHVRRRRPAHQRSTDVGSQVPRSRIGASTSRRDRGGPSPRPKLSLPDLRHGQRQPAATGRGDLTSSHARAGRRHEQRCDRGRPGRGLTVVLCSWAIISMLKQPNWASRTPAAARRSGWSSCSERCWSRWRGCCSASGTCSGSDPSVRAQAHLDQRVGFPGGSPQL